MSGFLQIFRHDEYALQYLKDIKCCKMHDPEGFKLEFLFHPNPYFKNSVPTKTYHVSEELDEPIWSKEIGTDIEWYPGADIRYTFFEFFAPLKSEDFTQEHLVSWFKRQIKEGREKGLLFRKKIIPHAVSWFTRESLKPWDMYIESDSSDSKDYGVFSFSNISDDEDEEYAARVAGITLREEHAGSELE